MNAENDNGIKLRRLEDLVVTVVSRMLPCATGKSCKEIDRVTEATAVLDKAVTSLQQSVDKKFGKMALIGYTVLGGVIASLMLLIMNLAIEFQKQ